MSYGVKGRDVRTPEGKLLGWLGVRVPPQMDHLVLWKQTPFLAKTETFSLYLRRWRPDASTTGTDLVWCADAKAEGALPGCDAFVPRAT